MAQIRNIFWSPPCSLSFLQAPQNRALDQEQQQVRRKKKNEGLAFRQFWNGGSRSGPVTACPPSAGPYGGTPAWTCLRRRPWRKTTRRPSSGPRLRRSPPSTAFGRRSQIPAGGGDEINTGYLGIPDRKNLIKWLVRIAEEGNEMFLLNLNASNFPWNWNYGILLA